MFEDPSQAKVSRKVESGVANPDGRQVSSLLLSGCMQLQLCVSVCMSVGSVCFCVINLCVVSLNWH